MSHEFWDYISCVGHLGRFTLCTHPPGLHVTPKDGYKKARARSKNQSVWVSFGLKTDPQREPKTNNHSNGLIQYCPYELGSSSQPKRLCMKGEGQPHARRSTFDFSVGHFGTTMERGHLKIETANRGFPITSMATSASDFRVTCGFMLQQL